MRMFGVVLAVVLLAAAGTALLVIAGWPASAYVHNDFATFWAGSRLLVDGGDPYDRQAFIDLHKAIGSRGPIGLPFITGYVYPLTTAIAFAPFALLPVPIAAPLWLVCQLAAASAALVALGRALYQSAARRELTLLFGLAIASQSMWLLVAGGNIGGFALAIVATACALLLRGQFIGAGVALGLLVVKPHPMALAVPLMLMALPRASALRVTVAGAGVAAAALTLSLVMRPGWIGEDLARLSSVAANAGRQSTVFGLFGPEFAAGAWFAVAAIAIAFAGWLRSRPPFPLAMGAAVTLSVFCAPYGWSYDHTLLLVPVAVALALVSRSTPSARLTALLMLALTVVILPWTTYFLAFRRGEESLSALVPLAVLGALIGASYIAHRIVAGCPQGE